MSRFTTVIIALLIGILSTWLLWPRIAVVMVGPCSDMATRGTWGDSFGALNTLFTGLATLGVIATLWLQMDQNRKSENERNERVFEDNFFRLLQTLREVVAGIKVVNHLDRNESWTGRDALGKMLDELRGIVTLSGEPSAPIRLNGNSVEDLVQSFENLFEKHRDDLGPYFRLLYHVLRFVDRSKVNNKSYYTDLIRAELSASELALIIPNGLSDQGRKMKPLIEKYHLLKHFPVYVFDPNNRLLGPYSPTAFKDADEL